MNTVDFAPEPVEGVLFDMDGLLLNTEVIYTRVSQEIVSRYGKTFDWSVKSNMIGRPAIDSSRYLVEALEIPMTPEEYLTQREQLLRRYLANCLAMPGAEQLVRHLNRHQIPIAIATSSSHELFLIKVKRHRNWIDLFDIVVTGDDPAVQCGKPAPDIFLETAAKLNIATARALVFEDAPSGLEAGLSAGMRVIVVPDPNMDKSRYRGALQILESLLDFEPASLGLPARHR